MSFDVDQASERTSSIAVSRGLFALRYTESAAGAGGPIAFVRQGPGSEATIRLIPYPGDAPGRLEGAGSCMVVVAEQPGNLQITVRRRDRSNSLNATFQLQGLDERKSTRMESTPVVSDMTGHGSDPIVSGAPGLRMFAHVARQGDVEARDGQWIAGPNAPAPIEGIEIRLETQEFDIETQVLVGGRWSRWIGSRSYVGTKGRAIPLTGLRFRLVGDAGANAAIEAECLFLGSAIQSRSGQQIELVGSSGADPLVGIKIGLRLASSRAAGSIAQPMVAQPMPTPSQSWPQAAAPSPAQKAARVRVFRASEARSS
ncbi:hypothetical protein [Lichenihabitans psoromatis]|uniref:hypothetical protein n=1 Tax=Lichenihabitans psoromatis TaxID=2528642 RepID=UPI0010365C78|nr:hypothetical protein [Lichenihabitans psoromatis]